MCQRTATAWCRIDCRYMYAGQYPYMPNPYVGGYPQGAAGYPQQAAAAQGRYPQAAAGYGQQGYGLAGYDESAATSGEGIAVLC